MTSSEARARLCRVDEIADGESRGFFVELDGTWHNLFAVRRGDSVFAYVNSCPHTGAPLNFLPDRFLDIDGTRVLCTNHGALFNIDDGHCIHGPCAGKDLQSVPVSVENGEVFVGGP
jgi:nitrite reductase/ring-hydroxylating ferredoxin subunit